MSFLLIYVTHPSKPEAVRISASLLNAHLIACVNYSSIESTFWWEGQLTHSEEILTIYKTSSENWEKVKEYIEKNHKYTTPCIIKLATVEANTSYEDWIRDQTNNTFTPRA
ncbi:divalent-cation tolerance protein CutA [Candidatus Gracilibacteria bacterium]|nr:divalent-cation tolerance protein CutA [Candidatus Gracilibacteria bacterium]